jgi:hypothetical protein
MKQRKKALMLHRSHMNSIEIVVIHDHHVESRDYCVPDYLPNVLISKPLTSHRYTSLLFPFAETHPSRDSWINHAFD